MINSDGTGIVLAWPDGNVSKGADNLRNYLTARQYGMGDEVPNVFVNVDGDLKPVLVVIDPMEWDSNDYAYPSVRLFVAVEGVNVQDEHAPFCVFGLRIDGRA